MDLLPHRTLELGSLDVNGSVRKLFSGEYVGIDRVQGPGVDPSWTANALDFPDASFDTVVSTSMLEARCGVWRRCRSRASAAISATSSSRRSRRASGSTMSPTTGGSCRAHGRSSWRWQHATRSTRAMIRIT